MKKLFFCLSLFFCTSTLFFAQKVKVEAVLDKDTIQSGESIQLLLTVQQTDDVAVIWPIINDSLANGFEVVQRKDVDTSFNKQQTGVTYKQQFVITNFKGGTNQLEPFTFRYLEGKDTLFVSTQAISVNVKVPKVDTEKEFKDITGVLDVPIGWLEFLWLYIVIFITLLGALGFYIYYKTRKNKPAPIVVEKPAPVIPADIIAFEKLEAIKLKKLWQSGQLKQYFIELTEIVREYIDARYKIDAEEMTTSEILRALQLTDAPQEARLELMKLLQLADLVKFAKGNSSEQENEKAWEQAYKFVLETKEVPVAKAAEKPSSQENGN